MRPAALITAAMSVRRPYYDGGKRFNRRFRHAACASRYTNFALHAMQTHRLWINLWISLGHPAENWRQSGGNAAMTQPRRVQSRRLPTARTQARHRGCARARWSSPARTPVIPRIHRPYDDYQLVM
jgi:hypothetical protein